MASGQTLTLRKIFLFDADAVAEITALRAQAAKGLAPSGGGVGIFGTPSLAFAAEAAAMFAVTGFLANAAQKAALEFLKKAHEKYEKLADHGFYFNAIDVVNHHVPRPESWLAYAGSKGQKVDMSKWPRSQIDSFLLKHNKTKRDLAGWTVLISVPKQYIHNGDEFLNVVTDAGYVSIRWANIVAYFPPQQLPS